MRKSPSRAPAYPRIVVDTREQDPYSWGLESPAVRRKLDAGDYSLEGFEARVSIERKTLSDAIGTIGRGRDRFERELVRLAALDYAAIVIEAGMPAFIEEARMQWDERAGRAVHPHAAIGSLVAWDLRYGVRCWFAGDRPYGAALTRKLLFGWWKETIHAA